MNAVVLNYPTGATREVLLSGVPRVGEHIRLRDAKPSDQSLVVQHVLWMEGGSNGSPEPEVVVAVRPHDPS